MGTKYFLKVFEILCHWSVYLFAVTSIYLLCRWCGRCVIDLLVVPKLRLLCHWSYILLQNCTIDISLFAESCCVIDVLAVPLISLLCHRYVWCPWLCHWFVIHHWCVDVFVVVCLPCRLLCRASLLVSLIRCDWFIGMRLLFGDSVMDIFFVECPQLWPLEAERTDDSLTPPLTHCTVKVNVKEGNNFKIELIVIAPMLLRWLVLWHLALVAFGTWLTPTQMQKKMGIGINLGNTLDAPAEG